MNNEFFNLSKVISDFLYDNYRLLSYSQAKRLLKLQMEFLESAAKEGDVQAQFDLALMYKDCGYLTPNPYHNRNKVIKWFRIASKNGNSDAKANLSVEYLSNYDGNINGNIVRALDLLKDAYNKGNGLAILNYKINLKELKNRKSELRQQLLVELSKLPNNGEIFLKKHPDFALALGKR